MKEPGTHSNLFTQRGRESVDKIRTRNWRLGIETLFFTSLELLLCNLSLFHSPVTHQSMRTLCFSPSSIWSLGSDKLSFLWFNSILHIISCLGLLQVSASDPISLDQYTWSTAQKYGCPGPAFQQDLGYPFRKQSWSRKTN